MKNQTRKKHNCERREACTCSTPSERPYCKYWIASRGSKYYYCGRYLRNRITCELDKSACAECPFHIPNEEGESPKRGAPNLTGINWKDKAEVAEYHKYDMRVRRAVAKKRREEREAWEKQNGE